MCKVIEDMRREEREEGIREGMKAGLKEGRKEGMKAGRKESMRAAALRMLGAGKYVLDEIADISGLSLDEVKKLQASQNV